MRSMISKGVLKKKKEILPESDFLRLMALFRNKYVHLEEEAEYGTDRSDIWYPMQMGNALPYQALRQLVQMKEFHNTKYFEILFRGFRGNDDKDMMYELLSQFIVPGFTNKHAFLESGELRSESLDFTLKFFAKLPVHRCCVLVNTIKLAAQAYIDVHSDPSRSIACVQSATNLWEKCVETVFHKTVVMLQRKFNLSDAEEEAGDILVSYLQDMHRKARSLDDKRDFDN